MLDVLFTAERALPELLKDEAGWSSVYADTEKPALQRLWRQWGEHRIYLHRFETCTPEEAFLHPHPWKFAIRLLKGRYEMSIGASNDPHREPETVVRMIMEPGSCYEMAHPHGWHAIRPVDEETYSLMVAGPPVYPQNRIPANTPVRELMPEERRMLFDFFASKYPTTATTRS